MAGELIRIGKIKRHGSRQEGHGVIGLEPGGLIAHQRISRSVGFIEAVIRKAFHQVENLGRFRGFYAARFRAIAENLALGFHFAADLLAHGATQQVSGAERIARQILRNLHDLFLIDHDAIGLRQYVPDCLMRRFPSLAMFAGAIGRDIRHGARAIQRHRRHQIFKTVRAHLS